MTKSKYKNKRTEVNGIRFDSKGEADCYLYLRLLERAHEIRILELQQKIYLSAAKILYKPDFTVLDLRTNETYWIDYKGMATAVFRIKARLWEVYGPGRLLLYSGYGLNMKIDQTIIASGGTYEIRGTQTQR